MLFYALLYLNGVLTIARQISHSSHELQSISSSISGLTVKVIPKLEPDYTPIAPAIQADEPLSQRSGYSDSVHRMPFK